LAGARAIQAQQGGIHGNPASGNRPLKRPTTGTVTLKKKGSVDNTYQTLHLPIPTDHEGRVGWEQDSAMIRLNRALEKFGNQQQLIGNDQQSN